jgi:primosomal protein N' (replication factor Y)
VIIQTWAPSHPAIEHARRHDFEGFAALELAARAKHGNPPFGHVALVRISGEQRSQVEARAKELGGMAAELCARVAQSGESRVESLGPVDSPIERINRRVRMQILLPGSPTRCAGASSSSPRLRPRGRTGRDQAPSMSIHIRCCDRLDQSRW